MPEVASRAHLEAMVPTIQRACETAGVALTDLDGIAVTSGPGLAGALMVGVASAKALALSLGLPLWGQSPRLPRGRRHRRTRALAGADDGAARLGGHSSLLLVPDVTSDVRPLGSTIDDAAGEAFDKVARVLGLPFPVDRTSTRRPETGRSPSTSAWADGWPGHGAAPFRLLVLGLKTTVTRWVTAEREAGRGHTGRGRGGEFQEAVTDVLTRKAIDACREHGADHPADRWRCRGQLAAARDGPGAVRQGGNPAPRAEAGLCTDNARPWSPRSGADDAQGREASRLDLPADSSMPVTLVRA